MMALLHHPSCTFPPGSRRETVHTAGSFYSDTVVSVLHVVTLNYWGKMVPFPPETLREVQNLYTGEAVIKQL